MAILNEIIVNQSTTVSGNDSILTINKLFSGQIVLRQYIDDVETGRILLSADDVRALAECDLIGECF